MVGAIDFYACRKLRWVGRCCESRTGVSRRGLAEQEASPGVEDEVARQAAPSQHWLFLVLFGKASTLAQLLSLQREEKASAFQGSPALVPEQR